MRYNIRYTGISKDFSNKTLSQVAKLVSSPSRAWTNMEITECKVSGNVYSLRQTAVGVKVVRGYITSDPIEVGRFNFATQQATFISMPYEEFQIVAAMLHPYISGQFKPETVKASTVKRQEVTILSASYMTGLIRSHFNQPKYELIPYEEWYHDGDSEILGVDGADYDDYDRASIAEFRQNVKKTPGMRIFLDYFCYVGLLEKGDYIVTSGR
jgi:hypothetical protein